jgi:ABC-type lipoprotein release transport system permease subunit
MHSTRRRFVLIVLATGVFSLGAVPTAHADVTGFVGGMTSTSGGMAGGAAGKCFARACWEVEYARAHGGSPTDAGSLETVGLNVLVQFKSPIQHVYAGFLAATAAVMMAAALLASIVPARRALSINPTEALKEV